MVKKLITHFRNDHLYRNSLYLMASTAVLAGFGFFFWIIAARRFTTTEVGIATTLISVTSLIAGLSVLGLNISLNRFLPKSENKNEMISSSSFLVILASILFTIAFLIGIEIFSPKLAFLDSNLIYIFSFIFFVIIMSLTSLIEYVFISYRASDNVLIKNTILSVLKLCFIFVFSAFGAYGIFSSFSFAMAISFFVALGILIFKFNFRPIFGINFKLIKSMGRFSIGNYIAGFLSSAPLLILPLLIINSIDAASAAYYYIDAMILGLLVTIPTAVSQSLLTEGSHDETKLRLHVIKASKITFLLLIPSVLITIFFGNYILQFFGKNYAIEAFRFLQIISLSALFIPIALFGNSILRVHHKIKALIILNLIGCFAILGCSYLLVPYGLTGVGIGLLIGQIITSGSYVIYYLISKAKK